MCRERQDVQTMVIEPALHTTSDSRLSVLTWRWTQPVTALSSASVGGGLRRPSWLVNIGVASGYARTDLAKHVSETAAEVGLSGDGIGLFTAADVRKVCRGVVEGVAADATVGVSKPTWAADPTDSFTALTPGTINLVIQLPVTLDPGAAVNAVITVTEAKTQAMLESDIHGTGTASDAVVIVWPEGNLGERFAGPRSTWGERIAQATHSAVMAGIANSASLRLAPE